MIRCRNCNELIESIEALYADDDFLLQVPMCENCAPGSWGFGDDDSIWDSISDDGLDEDDGDWDE